MLKHDGHGHGYGRWFGNKYNFCEFGDGFGDSHTNGDSCGSGWGDGVGYGDGYGCRYKYGDGITYGRVNGNGEGASTEENAYITVLIIDEDPVTAAYQYVIMQIYGDVND